jgi:hypothetical protein
MAIVRTIGNGEIPDQEMLTVIEKIAKIRAVEDSEKIHLCFIQTYYEMVVKSEMNLEIFALFKDSEAEYGGIIDCYQYYALLQYRARQLEHKDKAAVLAKLDDLQANAL